MANLTIRRKKTALTIRRKKPTRDDVRECDGRAYVRGSSEIANLHTRRGRRRKLHPADAEVLHLRSEGVRSHLGMRIQTKDTTASGFDRTGVWLRTPSDRRCNTSASAGWSLCRFSRRVCKLANSDDPRTYARPSHSLTSSLVGFFQRIVKAAFLRRIVRFAMLSMAVVPASKLEFFFCVSRPRIGMDVIHV